MQARPPAVSAPRDWIDWPFFDASHREFVARLDRFVNSAAVTDIDHDAVDDACRKLVRGLGQAGLLEAAVPSADGDASGIDSRSVCLARETLARRDGLADFAFAMQGLGSGAVAIAGSDALRAAHPAEGAIGRVAGGFRLVGEGRGLRRRGDGLLGARRGRWLCASMARKPGSPTAASLMSTRCSPEPAKRRAPAAFRRFVVFPDDPGFSIAERIDVIAPHPLATLRFENCRIPGGRRLGAPGGGFKIAMQTLDIFRASVAAAALGFARRALDEALDHARNRRMFGGALADLQLTQAALGDMATEIDAAALLTYRAAWRRDVQKLSTTREAAMAKMAATETGQRVIDRAVQIFGGRGVMRGEIVESLYREIRALRIYEGATEVQKLIVARELLKSR